MGWRRVDGRNRCPVCGHDSYCGIDDDGTVRCTRIESNKPSPGGDGHAAWIHKGVEGVQVRAREPAEPKPKLSVEVLTDLARRMYEHSDAGETRDRLAGVLGVSAESLESLRVGVGWDEVTGRRFSSWPARDWRGRIVGIVRRYDDGAKRSWPGGSIGLFYCRGWSRGVGPIFVVEGGSDAASAITANLSVIGRPSNTGGGDWIRRMVRARAGSRRVIVVAENDLHISRRGTISTCPTDCTGCLHCWPGRAGAEMVAKVLRCGYVMPPEGCKDFRDALNKGRLWPELLRAL